MCIKVIEKLLQWLIILMQSGHMSLPKIELHQIDKLNFLKNRKPDSYNVVNTNTSCKTIVVISVLLLKIKGWKQIIHIFKYFLLN